MLLSGFASRLKGQRERQGFLAKAFAALLLFTVVVAGILGWSGPALAIDEVKIGPDAVNAFGDYSQYHFYMYSSYDVVAAAPDEKFGGLTSDNTCTFDISQNIVTGQLDEDANYAGIIFDQAGFSGSLTKVGTGEFILSGVNTYKGGTYINGGAIGVYNDWNLGDSSGGLGFDGGTLRYYGTFTSARSITLNFGGGTFDTNGFSPTLSGVISGAGSLTKTGLGKLTLTGTNTYTGDTIIDGGTLVVAHHALPSSTDVIINSSGTLSCADGTANYMGSLSGSGNLVFGAGSSLWLTDDTDTVFSGSISGWGQLLKFGSGTMYLTGTGSGSPIFIHNGRVIVDGNLSTCEVEVFTGCVLGGAGTVGATSNRGTVAPGDSIGTLTVNGHYNQFSGGTYEAEVDSSGASDLLSITDTASLDGTLSIIATPGTYGALTNYTLLTSSGGLGGTTFSSIITNLPAYLGYDVTYDANNVFLQIFQLGFGSTPGFTYNQNSVSGALDGEAMTATGDMIDLLNAVYALPASYTPAALDSLTGEVHTVVAQSSVDFPGCFMSSVDARLAQARGGMRASKDAPVYVMLASADDGMTDAGSMYASGPAEGTHIGLWIRGSGVFGETDPDGNAHSYDYNIGGTSGGLEFDNGRGLVLGIGGGYGMTNIDMESDLGEGDVGSAQAGAYAGYRNGPVYVDGAFGYAYNHYETDRSIPLTGGTASADYSGDEYSVMAEAGYGLEMAGLDVTPLASFRWTRLDTEGFTESGAGAANLSVEERSSDSLRYGAGIKVAKNFVMSDGLNVLPELRGRWTHEAGNNDQTISASFAGGTGGTFPVRGLDIGRDKAVVGAGVSVFYEDEISIAIDYDAELNSELTAHAVTGEVKYMW